ncbi:histidine phosphatase family protein [Mesobacillus selenatarsenatis]|uniref:Phosphoglycerate mutase family 2 n=1 Tax=Mesobacillus selenatarsenatis (strain DSM 18680 / JCM 14380 / FERM P-15431 / SF-1) TaxID=1321606 RepID=A0A0A8X4S6_MESS1|nr:histidine phosphatase family protein [Mesobacillus selenatarsenatis]GAM13156.1 phosphoglycerate mutase family 2 [Mesobacillus selenatarsenatis SF-1]
MNTEVYFVRHAHSVFSLKNEETRELSEKGWRDAEKITHILSHENINHIISSSYVRARQTVKGLADLMDLEIELDSRFRERDLAARNHHFENPEEAMQKVFSNPVFKYPGGETNHEVQQRGIDGLRDAVKKFEGQKIAIGIHGNIMTCTMNYFDEKYDFEFWKQTTKPDIYKLTINDRFELVSCERLWKEEIYSD